MTFSPLKNPFNIYNNMSAAPKLGARTASARSSKSLTSASRLKKTPSDSKIGPATRSSSTTPSLVKKTSKIKVKKEENPEESEFRKRLSAYRKNKNAHAPEMDIKARTSSPRTTSPRVSSSPAMRRPSSSGSVTGRNMMSSKSPSRRPSTGRSRPKASPLPAGRKRTTSKGDENDNNVQPPLPPHEDDRALAVAGFLHEQEPNFDLDGITQTGLDVGKLTSMFDTINTRYGTKELKKRAFAVLIKQVGIIILHV